MTATTPEAPRLRLEFQLTEDDLREAMRTHNRRAERSTIILVLTMAAFMVWRLHTDSEPERSGDQVAGWSTTILVTIPWALLFALIWYTIYRLIGGGTHRAWQGAPTLQLPRAIEVDGSRLFSVDALVRSELLWPAFVMYRESTNLFLLYTARTAFLMIPKRSFASADAQAWFRELLRTRVPIRFGRAPGHRVA